MIKRNYYKVVRVLPDPSSYFYIKNETMSNSQILFRDEWLPTVNLEYSIDKVNWNVLNNNTYRFPADSYMYFRNTSGTFCTSEYGSIFYLYDNFSIGGDIRTLFNYTDVESVTKIPDYGFSEPFVFFNDCKCIDISNLRFRGITEIGNYGLRQAFVSYNGTKGVDLRGVTTIDNNALEFMYSNCSNLTEVYAPNVSEWDRSKSRGWLSGVASTGVVYKPSTLDISTDDSSGIPYNWTTQDYPIE